MIQQSDGTHAQNDRRKMTQPERGETYGQFGSTFVDRLRIYLVGLTINRYMPKRSQLDVLDLGCGYHAGYLRAMHSRVRSGTGIDYRVSEEVQKLPRLRFIEDSIESALPSLAAEQFDLILFISVLEHVWDPLSCLRECHRVLKKGGLIMINVPTWFAKPVLEFSAFRLGTSPVNDMEDHKMYYNKHALWPLLVQAGFKPSQIKLRYRNLRMTLLGLVRR
jgi:SAM-dependent methyltransferase